MKSEIEPLHSLDKEFGIYWSLADFPISALPAYLNEMVGGVCLSGSATLRVGKYDRRIRPDVIFTLIPWQLVSIRNASDDFSVRFCRVSKEMSTDSLSTLWMITPDYFSYMHRNFATEPNTENRQRFMSFLDNLVLWENKTPFSWRRETIMQFLRLYYWTAYAFYLDDPDTRRPKYSRKEELTFDFIRLVVENHSVDKEVSCYAEKLNIAPRYLTNVVKSVSGRSAREWIVYYTILEVKSLLRQTSTDIKSIVAHVNFPDQSSLSRYFRKYTGMSPSEYREQASL